MPSPESPAKRMTRFSTWVFLRAGVEPLAVSAAAVPLAVSVLVSEPAAAVAVGAVSAMVSVTGILLLGRRIGGDRKSSRGAVRLRGNCVSCQ